MTTATLRPHVQPRATQRAARSFPTTRASLQSAAPAAAGRRAVLVTLLSVVPALPALALLPDDDDAELLARTKAVRQNKIAEDKASQRAFVQTEGYASPASLAAAQTAVSALSKVGFLLTAGRLDEAKTTASGPWVADLKRAVAASGSGDAAGEDTLQALAQLQRADSAEAAKAAYVLAVDGLGGWAAASGLANKLKGL